MLGQYQLDKKNDKKVTASFRNKIKIKPDINYDINIIIAKMMYF